MKKKEKTKQKQSQRQSQNVIVNVKTEAPKQRRKRSTKSKGQEESKPSKPSSQAQTIPYLGLQSANNAQLLNSLQTSLAAIYRGNQSNTFSQATAPTPVPTPAPISRPLLMAPETPTARTNTPLMITMPPSKPLLSAVETRTPSLKPPPLRITDAELMPPPPPRPPKAAPLTNPKNVAFKNVSVETVNTDTESEFEKPKRKTAKDVKTGRIVEEITPVTIEQFGLTYNKDGTINQKSKAFRSLPPEKQQDLLDSQALSIRTKEREKKLTPVKEKEKNLVENIIKEHKTHTKTEIVEPKMTNEITTFLNPEESEVDQIEDK
jgi:hypothetical protein